MGSRKTFNIFVALLLVLGIFATSAFSKACFCGQACFHGLNPKPKIKVNSLFHMRCTGGLCKGCDLEEGQNLKIASCPVLQSPNIKIFDNVFILPTFVSHPSHYHILEHLNAFYVCEIAPSLPIYLQKLSLLC